LLLKIRQACPQLPQLPSLRFYTHLAEVKRQQNLVFLVVLGFSVPAVDVPVSELHIVSGGDSARGRELVYDYGCGSYHTVPGVRGAEGKAGPYLGLFGQQSYIAGNLPNTPENLVRWIMFPQQVEPGTAMPNLNVTAEDARHIAAYLYSIADRGAP
jgi:cytochrome c